jgi:hypothetical protein
MLKRRSVVAVLLTIILLGLAPAYGSFKDKNDSGRMLTGKVTDKQDNPLPNSVVYLSNTRTRAVKTYIVGSDGAYHFPELSPHTDYEVYAQYKGQKSDTKTMSQFDERKVVNINLRIESK